MKKIKIKNRPLFKLIIILIISLILGLLYLSIISKNNISIIKSNLNTYINSLKKLNYLIGLKNCLTSNLIYIIVIWLLGISIIGIPIIILILIIKSFILGFTISSIIYTYGIIGIPITIIYTIPLIINLFLLTFLGYYGIIFSKNLNKLLFLKKEINFKNIMKRYIKLLIFSILITILSSLIEIYIIPNILKLLQIQIIVV